MYGINVVDKIIEPVLIYTMTILYYWLQMFDLAEIDMVVNIILGLIISGYTALKAYELFLDIIQEHAEKRMEEEDAD